MIHDLSPQQAWEKLTQNPSCVLLDVRSYAEWQFVGAPDLSALNKDVIFIEWKSFPRMQTNKNFANDVLVQIEGQSPSEICFLCRSGQRSMAAGMMMQAYFDAQGMAITCFNVAQGFEGDLNADARRGTVNGWKVAGLAWRQS